MLSLQRVRPAGHRGSHRQVPGLRVSFRNGPLVGFCIYFCLYNIVACSFIPLSVVYMKSAEFNAPPSAIMSVAEAARNCADPMMASRCGLSGEQRKRAAGRSPAAAWPIRMAARVPALGRMRLEKRKPTRLPESEMAATDMMAEGGALNSALFM